MEYAAEDFAFIKRRAAEIAREEALIGDINIDTATGHDLELIARSYGLYRESGESDYPLRNRIRAHKTSNSLA